MVRESGTNLVSRRILLGPVCTQDVGWLIRCEVFAAHFKGETGMLLAEWWTDALMWHSDGISVDNRLCNILNSHKKQRGILIAQVQIRTLYFYCKGHRFDPLVQTSWGTKISNASKAGSKNTGKQKEISAITNNRTVDTCERELKLESWEKSKLQVLEDQC